MDSYRFSPDTDKSTMDPNISNHNLSNLSIEEFESDPGLLHGPMDKKEAKENEGTSRNKNRDIRKLTRKCTKAMTLISNKIGIPICSDPCEWIVVWGLGIAGGNSKKFIMEFFSPKPLEIRLVSDKTFCYCFIRSASLKEAEYLKAKYNGQMLNEKQVIYIGFLGKDPEEENLDSIQSFENTWPEGLSLYPDFVTDVEEQEILNRLGNGVHETTGRILKHRSVRHFGYEFRYGSNDIDFENPLPEGVPTYMIPVVEALRKQSVFQDDPEQITVNQYQPGQGIPPHVDTHSCFEGPIVSLSLGSDTVMEFRRGVLLVSVILPSKSLLVMNGAARHSWTHAIASRSFDIIPDDQNGGLTILNRGIRTSLTLRKLRTSRVCDCIFPDMCDSQKGKITDENAPDLEDKLVHNVYEHIAPHFDETRHTPWPRVKQFIENFSDGDYLLDVGCGNGKYFHLNKKIIQIGSDMSQGLLGICRGKDAEVIRANALRLPFSDKYFEAVICIAVLHHISTEDRRLAAVREMIRVLKVGGQALIYVWAKDQRIEDTDSAWASKQTKNSKHSTFISACSQPIENYSFLPIHDNDKNFPRNDMLVPWINSNDKQVSSVHHRYYHVFNKGELEELVMKLQPEAKIIDSYYDQGNWVVNISKTESKYSKHR